MYRIKPRLANVSAVFGQRIEAALRLIYGLSHAWLPSFFSLLFSFLPTIFFFFFSSLWLSLSLLQIPVHTNEQAYGDACVPPLPPPPPLRIISPPTVLGLFMRHIRVFCWFARLISSHLTSPHLISSHLIGAFREGEARYVPLGFKAQLRR